MRGSSPHRTDSASRTADQQILQIFRSNNGKVVSGEYLSATLNMSRTAVWKHIRSLKEMGYRIAAVPSQGYRLLGVPDALLPAEIAAGLSSQRIGRRIISHDEIESTNDTAFRLADEEAEEGTVVVAETQLRGKGRMGRQWASPPGVNLYCSAILRPPIVPMQAAQLTLCSAIAVSRAIEQTTGLRPAIKWPNDILLSKKKVAGLLNEMSAETDKVNFIVLGIGININMTQEQFPDDLRHPATSLYLELGSCVDRCAVARALLQALDELYDTYLTQGYQPIRNEWLQRSNILHQRVRVDLNERTLTGTVTGIDEYGALLLTTADGASEKILAGDVTIL